MKLTINIHSPEKNPTFQFVFEDVDVEFRQSNKFVFSMNPIELLQMQQMILELSKKLNEV